MARLARTHTTSLLSRPGRLLLTGTGQGYFLDSQFKYLTKYLYGPLTIPYEVCIPQLFLYLVKNPFAFPSFREVSAFPAGVAGPLSAPTARQCSIAAFEVGQMTWREGFLQPPSDVSSAGTLLLLKDLRFINQLNLRNFRAKEIFQIFMVKSHMSTQEKKEPLRKLGSLFRIRIVT